MFDTTFPIGLIGALVLVAGAAWPDRAAATPTRSVKNWLFALGGLLMLCYSTLNWMHGGPIFFVILQLFVNVSSVLMMLHTSDRLDTWVLSLCAIALITWSLLLFEGVNTVFFILGLTGIGLGYAFEGGSVRRDSALAGGSALIALFSYLEASWIFFWLNVFFALFSCVYLVRGMRKSKKAKN